MVLYDFDFMENSATLNTAGRDRLEGIAQMLPASFAPIIVERTPGNPGLAERRKQMVLRELQKHPFPIPPERVVVGRPVSHGLAGTEAELIDTNQTQQTKTRGRQSVGPATVSLGGGATATASGASGPSLVGGGGEF
jgi:hypothetical protein